MLEVRRTPRARRMPRARRSKCDFRVFPRLGGFMILTKCFGYPFLVITFITLRWKVEQHISSDTRVSIYLYSAFDTIKIV